MINYSWDTNKTIPNSPRDHRWNHKPQIWIKRDVICSHETYQEETQSIKMRFLPLITPWTQLKSNMAAKLKNKLLRSLPYMEAKLERIWNEFGTNLEHQAMWLDDIDREHKEICSGEDNTQSSQLSRRIKWPKTAELKEKRGFPGTFLGHLLA